MLTRKMFRLPFTKLLNVGLLMKSSNTLCRIQKHNLAHISRRRVPEKTLAYRVSTSLRERHIQNTDNEESDAFAILERSYKFHGHVQARRVSNTLEDPNFNILNKTQYLLLLECCGQAIVDNEPSARSNLCNQVWAKLEESGIYLDLQYFNKYLEICIENKDTLSYIDFISKMKNCHPDEETYHLLLQCACQLGDIPQAIKIISEMKIKQFPVDEKTFNLLVLGNAIQGGLDDALKVVNTMQAAGILPSSLTYWCLLQGIAEYGNHTEFLKAVQMHPGETNEQGFLKLLQILGLRGNHTWIDEIFNTVQRHTFTKEGLLQLNLLCVHLVHMRELESAFYYHKEFVSPGIAEEESQYSVLLFGQMLISGIPTNKIIKMAKELGDINYSYIIRGLTEVALKRRLTEAALDLFQEMPYLRPHYFWPILLRAASEQRENGIFAVMSKMFELGVKPDDDTLELYVIPHCDTNDPINLLRRIKHLGFTYKELLTPMLSYLLKNDQLAAAENLCLTIDGISIEPGKLIQPLGKAWINVKDCKNIVALLKRLEDVKEYTDPIGKVVVQSFKACKTPADYNRFLELTKVIHNENIKISTTSADSTLYSVKDLNHGTLKETMRKAIEAITDHSLDNTYTLIPHPRNMSVSELENHLIQLQNKDMGTRGVLRLLIQDHCRLGNETRVNELRQQFLNAGFNESAGMKASLFHTYVNKGKDVSALNMYNEIKLQHPNFILDDFKVVDFTTLLVQNSKYDIAVKVLTETRACRGGPGIIRNCWDLLSAANEESHLQKLYQLLTKQGYCVPCNIILGPLVKIHIKSGDLEKAVQVYAECAKRYRRTPLQVELLRAIIEAQNIELLPKVISITTKVHGPSAANVSVISTLSQSGLEKTLKHFLLEDSSIINANEVIKLCDRWVQLKDVNALETLAKAVFNFPPEKFDETIVYHYLMQVHGINNDCESAVKFYRQLLDLKIDVPEKLTQELLRMVHRCNYILSEDLSKEPVIS